MNKRIVPFVLALLLCLGGCGQPSHGEEEASSSTPSSIEESSAQPVLTTKAPIIAVDPEAPFTPFEPWVPSGEVVMPPLKGKEMLYPTYGNTVYRRSEGESPRYGLINAKGEIVAPIIYDEMQYVTNADQTAVLGVLMGTMDQEAEAYRWVYYGLDGKILAEPTHRGWMRPFPSGRYAAVSRSYGEDSEIPDERSVHGGIWNLEENRLVLAPSYRQHITQIDTDKFFAVTNHYDDELGVIDVLDSFIFDAKSGKRSPAPKDIGNMDSNQFAWDPILDGAPLPAENTNRMWGYVDGNMQWAVQPEYSFVTELLGRGWAVAGYNHLIDAWGKVIYESASSLYPVGNNYGVSRDSNYIFEGSYDATTALLHMNGAICEKLLELTPSQKITWLKGDLFAICDEDAGTTIFWDFAAGKAVDELNTCYSYAWWLNDNLVQLRADNHVAEIYNIKEKRMISLPEGRDYSFRSIGSWAIMCWDYKTDERFLLDAQGNPLDLGEYTFTNYDIASYTGLPDLLPAYPWVTQGLYAGYIDEQGNWLYRQSKYQELED